MNKTKLFLISCFLLLCLSSLSFGQYLVEIKKKEFKTEEAGFDKAWEDLQAGDVLVDGDFSSAAGWTLGGLSAIAGGKLTLTAGGSAVRELNSIGFVSAQIIIRFGAERITLA